MWVKVETFNRARKNNHLRRCAWRRPGAQMWSDTKTPIIFLDLSVERQFRIILPVRQ
jgi:hypothetical protein